MPKNEIGDDLNACKVWKSPFRDAADIIIERILDPKTVEPLTGFSDEELYRQHEVQNEIMESHDDYASLRRPNKKQNQSNATSKFLGISAGSANKKKEKRESRGLATISKIIATETDPNPPPPRPVPPQCVRADSY